MKAKTKVYTNILTAQCFSKKNCSSIIGRIKVLHEYEYDKNVLNTNLKELGVILKYLLPVQAQTDQHQMELHKT